MISRKNLAVNHSCGIGIQTT